MEFTRATPHDAERILEFWKDSGASMGATDDMEHLRRVVKNPAAMEFWTAVGYPRDDHIVRHVGTLD